MLAALKNDAYQPAIIGVNAPDSTGRMTVIYRSPYTATKAVTMYWRVNTDAASGSQPHGNVTMTSLGSGLFKASFDYDGSAGFTLAFQCDGKDNAWSSPAKQAATARRFAYVDDASVSYLQRRNRSSSNPTGPRPRPWAVSGAARKNCTTA